MNVHLIYASTSGNVEATVEFIAKLLSYMGFETTLSRAEQTSISEILDNSKFVFATSTWDHGKLNPFFLDLYAAMQKHNFQNKQAAFVGLGDRRYEPVLFCNGIDMLHDTWLERGGESPVPTLKIQGEPYRQLSATVSPWTNLLAKIWAYKK